MAAPASHDSLHIEASSFDARQSLIADELVEIASSAANAQLDALISQLADLLYAASQRHAAAGDADDARRCVGAVTLLKQNRYPFFYLAASHIRTALEQAMQAVLHPAPAFHDTFAPLAPLVPLAPDLEVDKKLSLIKISRAIENDCMESFSTLAARLTHLFGCRALTIADHPFRPSLYLNALHDAWCKFQPDSRVHHLMFRSLGPNLCINMAPILDALNAALAKRGVLPTLPLSMMVRSTDIIAEAPAGETPDEAVADPVLAQLQRLFPRAAHAQEPAARQARANAFPALFQEDLLTTHSAHHALLARIAELQGKGGGLRQPARQQTVLNELLHSAPDGGWPQADRATLELLAKVFDAIFGNLHIPAEMKDVLGALQLPVLKAALQDTAFFFSDCHPARRTIELLAQVSIDCDVRKGAGDPLRQLVLRNVKRIQSDQRSLAFAAALTDIETFLAAEDERAQQALATPIAQALRKEKTLHAARAAKRDVALRIGTGEIAAFVETFLEDKWVTVLTLAYTLKDDKPQALGSATRTMDDLCWSVKPKITPEERRELVARLPAIVAMLNKWLDAIKWSDEARARFFDELARCHASIVRAPVELSPERRMQLALKAAKKAAERRLQRQQNQAPEPAPDAFDAQVGALSSGAWVMFAQADGPGLKVRLAWVSPMRSLYLFATPERREAFSLSDQDFARALREQRARVVHAAGLVGRALADALLSKAANGDLLAKPSAA